MATQPSVQPPPSVDGAMASFSDLALPEVVPVKVPETPKPTVEADVISTEPAPPEAPGPPRRHADDLTPDKEGVEHVSENDKK